MTQSATALALAFAMATTGACAQQAAPTLTETQLLGRHLLAQSCGICHLQPSRNSVTYGPMLNKATLAGNDEVMRTLIVSGTDRMPSFRHYLKPDEIDAIIAYVRSVPAPAALAANEQKKGDAR